MSDLPVQGSVSPDECEHPEEMREYDPGNYVPPYGWEQTPTWFCILCNTPLDLDDEPYCFATDPDFQNKYEKENP